MDINQFEWDILEKKKSFWQATAMHAIILLPLLGGSLYGLYTFSYSQRYIEATELFVFLCIVTVITIIFINYLWYRITKALPTKLIHFKISQEGIEKNRKIIPLQSLNNPEILNTLKQNALPYQEWKQPRPTDGKPLELILATNQGKIVIEFPEEYVKQKFIRTTQEYLQVTTNQS